MAPVPASAEPRPRRYSSGRAISAPACATCAAARGCGRRSSAPRSPTCCSWGRPRCCCRSWSSTSSPTAQRDLGLIFAAGGLGSLACARRDRPARPPAAQHHLHVRRVDARRRWRWPGTAWRSGLWGLMLASVVFNTLETAGTIAWATAKQRHVPRDAARPRVEPGLADLDRPAPAFLRADGADQRRPRSTDDACGRRRSRCDRDVRARAKQARAPARRCRLGRSAARDRHEPPTLDSRPAQYGSRSSRLSTLPAPDFGSGSARSSICFGTL